MLRGEVFTAPGHEPESEELWREAWLAGLWGKEIARERRKHVESAFLAALMHRTGAALALVVGGALGNVIDRVRLGYVIDFIHVHWQDWYFPAFNVADSAISVGAVMLALEIVLGSRASRSA